MSLNFKNNLFPIFSALLKTTFSIVTFWGTAVFLFNSVESFNKSYLHQFGHPPQHPYLDFALSKWWIIALTLILWGLSVFYAYRQTLNLKSNFRTTKWIEIPPSRLETVLKNILPAKIATTLFPTNYFLWILLYGVVEMLKPQYTWETSALAAPSEKNLNYIVAFIIATAPPFLTLLDCYAVAIYFRKIKALLISLGTSSLIYFYVLQSAHLPAGNWPSWAEYNFLLPQIIYFLALPISFLFGLLAIKRF